MMQVSRYGHTSRLAVIAVAVGMLECLALRPGYAHGTAPPDLAFWGPFGKGTVRCLRKLSYASRRCFEEVLAVESEWVESRLSGQTCDEAGRGALVAAAQAEVAGVV